MKMFLMMSGVLACVASSAMATEYVNAQEGYMPDTPAYLQNRPMRAESILATRAGPDISVAYGHYTYNEPGVMMTLKHNLPSVKVGYTVLSDMGAVFARGEVEGFSSDMDYTGSTWGGTEITGTGTDTKVDARVLFGGDLVSLQSFVLVPYMGGGFRYLKDGKGTYSNPSVAGYDRRNMMLYGVLGLDTRWTAWDVPMEWRNEYDGFLWGKQTSYFSDTGGIDVDNKQKNGHGYRTHVAWLNRWVDVGLYYQHWNIGDSKTAWDGSTYVMEPKNSTREYGVFVRHRF